jgi:hypothetical protein
MNDHGILKPALIGGILLGILSALPVIQAFNCVCCAWVIGGGILAANLYVKSAPAAVTLGSGAGLGLLTGSIGGMVYILFSIPMMLLRNAGAGILEETRHSLSEIPNLPPAFRDAIASMPTGGSALALLMVFSALLFLVMFSVMGMLGGVLGVAIFEKRKISDRAPAAGLPIVLPPPPPPPDSPEP